MGPVIVGAGTKPVSANASGGHVSVTNGTGCPSAGVVPTATAHAGVPAGSARLVLIGGLPWTGKSTLAARLGEALGAVVLHSDEVRRHVARLSPAARPTGSFGQGMYSPEMTGLTYHELLTRARAALTEGRNVVLDASWHDPVWREEARKLAADVSADLAELRCQLPLETIAERVTGQAVALGNAAGETLALVRLLAASQHPWPSAITVDTAPGPTEVAQQVLRALAASD
jgi:predicted kinase